MKDLITMEVRKAALKKSLKMPMGTYSRLKVNGEILDIVIKKSLYGIFFYNEPNAIGKDIFFKERIFFYYEDLNDNKKTGILK